MKRRHRVTRWLVAAALLLIGGAIVNVAVAWGLTIWPIHESDSTQLPLTNALAWWLPMATPNDVFDWYKEVESLGRTELDINGYRMVSPHPGETAFAKPATWGYVYSGWPTKSLSRVWTADDESRLPVLPIWPGFAINTLFYAAILWMLFAAPFALRRKRRRKRGLCQACAYPIGTSPVCTECGRAVSK